MSPRRRRLSSDDEPLLFDLPLDDPTAVVQQPAGDGEDDPSQAELFGAEPAESASTPDPARPSPPPAPAQPVVASTAARLVSGGADLLLHGGVLAGVLLGLWAMEVAPRLEYWPAFLVLLLAFSFLYHVVCLAFWGQTAGMACCHLFSRDRLQRPLSFRQASLRWMGSLMTLVLAGVPLLLGLAGASLSDLVSGSVTLRHQAPPPPRGG